MAGVVLENVSRVFPGGTKAVDQINLEIRDKEFLVLVGPSGSGKSTTLRMIAGLEEVTTGRIRIGDRVVNDVSPKERNVAMVFQNYALYPHMTVYRNMAFGLELRYGGNWLRRAAGCVLRSEAARQAARRHEIDERVQTTAEVLGIEQLLDRLPRQLSGGERQRVALGRAMVRHPAVFLFDEPLSNLDAKLRVEMRRELKQLHRRLETTMVYVTHDQVEALTLGERIAVMDRGVLQQVGAPLEVYDAPKNRFVAGFIGTPPMNFIDGELDDEGGVLTFRRGSWRLPLAGEIGRRLRSANKKVTLGIRPEDVKASRDAQPAAGVLTATVTLVEPLGDATVLNLGLYDGQARRLADRQEFFNVVSKAEPRAGFSTGDVVGVTIAAERVHVFDGQSGENVACTQ